MRSKSYTPPRSGHKGASGRINSAGDCICDDDSSQDSGNSGDRGIGASGNSDDSKDGKSTSIKSKDGKNKDDGKDRMLKSASTSNNSTSSGKSGSSGSKGSGDSISGECHCGGSKDGSGSKTRSGSKAGSGSKDGSSSNGNKDGSKDGSGSKDGISTKAGSGTKRHLISGTSTKAKGGTSTNGSGNSGGSESKDSKDGSKKGGRSGGSRDGSGSSSDLSPLYTGMVPVNDTFIVTRSGKDTIDGVIVIQVKSTTGQVLQTITIDASCKEPLVEGDQFGSIKLVGFVDQKSCGFGDFGFAIADNDDFDAAAVIRGVESGGDMCDLCPKEPNKLQFEFTGIDLTSHHQGTRAAVTGSITGVQLVQVIIKTKGGKSDSDDDSTTGIIRSGVKGGTGGKKIGSGGSGGSKDSSGGSGGSKDGSGGSGGSKDGSGGSSGSKDGSGGSSGSKDGSGGSGGSKDGSKDGITKRLDRLLKSGTKDGSGKSGESDSSKDGTNKSATSKDDLVWFSSMVSVGEKFTIVGTGKNFPDETMVIELREIDGGALYQTIELYTRCDQKDTGFVIGDQFGSIKLVGYEDKNGCGVGNFVDIDTKGTNVGPDTCLVCKKPMRLKLLYTAEDISSHNQDKTKAFLEFKATVVLKVEGQCTEAMKG